MFGLLYHKQNPLITTVVYKAVFKTFKTIGRKTDDIFFARALQQRNYN